MITPRELQKQEKESSQCHILSFSSLGMPWERALMVIALAQSFSRQGYRVLVIDLDFEVPLIATTLIESGFDLSKSISTNDWYTTDKSLSTDELIQQLPSISPHPLFPVSVMPSSSDAKKLRLTQDMDNKSIRRALRKMSSFYKELQKEELFDIILVNVPYMTPHAINGMMTADFNFVIVDHETFSLNLIQRYIDAVVGIYPNLNIAGLILHRFKFSLPENDVVTTALIEEKLRFPVVAKLPSLRDELFTTLDKQLWSFQDQHLQDLFESIVFNLAAFIQSPRRFKKKTKLVYYQLYIVDTSGMQLFRYDFKKTADNWDEKGILASMGLSSIISGTETMISEIINQRESTKLIEMKNTKLIIEQWKNVKAILIANLCDEQTRRRLKSLVLHFVQRYSEELKSWNGDISVFKNSASLIEEHLLQERISEEKETLPLYLIRGIGKTRAWELQNIGITNVSELVKFGPAEIAQKLTVSIPLAKNWIIQGKKLLYGEIQTN